MYIEVAQSNLDEANAKLEGARNYRRFWAKITLGAAALSGTAMALSEAVGHNSTLPLGIVAIACDGAAVLSATQILDGFSLVQSVRDDVKDARRNLEEAQRIAQIQPELGE